MKKLIFDFDGTLVDSMGKYAYAVVDMLKQNNIKYPDNILKIITPLGYIGAAKYFVEELGLQMSVDEMVASMKELAVHEYANNIFAKDTVIETLRELKAKGYSMSILTASPHIALDVCLLKNGMTELFDNVWSCEDFETTKSDVNIYHTVAARLGTTVENCVFLDDNINALTVAKQSGMSVIGVYDKTSESYRDEIIALSDGYVEKMQQIVYILKDFE